MKNVVVLIASTLLLCFCAVAQNSAPGPSPEATFFQQVPAPAPGGPGAPNVFFRTQKLRDGKVTIAFADAGAPVTGAPYSATATTETTQVLADGNRIVNKTESLLARDSQGRTRRQ